MVLDLTDPVVKKGALDALNIILASRKKPIEVYADSGEAGSNNGMKMPKNSKVMSHEDEDEDGNGTPGETPEERQARIDRINDPEEIEKDIEEIKQDVEIRKGDAARARKKELDKIAAQNTMLDFRDFSVDLFKAVKSQITTAKQPEDTYSRPNATYAGSGYLMPGQDYPDKKSVPMINIYFDQSGSWGAGDIKKGLDALASIRQFEIRKKVKVNLYFFADHLHTTPKGQGQWGDPDYWYENGTGGFDEVMANIRDTRADNVIVMSDSDIQGQTDWKDCPKLEIPGCVWFLWRGGSRSSKAMAYLKGRRGTTQYNLQ